MPPNETLRSALAESGLNTEGLAERVETDPKTVQRWISKGRLPHPRTRVAVAEVLGTEVAVLWPDIVRRTVKVGPDREIVAAYPRRADVPRGFFGDLITRANRRLWFGGYTSYFVFIDVPDAAEMLSAKVQGGADVRFLLGDPGSVVTSSRERVEGTPLSVSTRIELTRAELGKAQHRPAVRFGDRHIAMSVWIFDDDAVVATHIGSGLGQESVTLHLRRHGDGGVFDRYAGHFEDLWAAGSSEVTK
jgi:hypothetical protein